MKSHRQRGFTLIELMIVVVIIAIIAAIAYPSYTRYVFQTRRADGQSALLQLQGQEEKYFAQCGQYTAQIVGGTISGCATAAGGLGYATNFSPDRNYTLSIGNLGAGNVYTATATPVGPQANDFDCLALTLDSQGVKGQAGPNAQGKCWQR